MRAFRSNHVPFAQGSNKLSYIASLTLLGRHREIKLEKAIKLYNLDPKPEDLVMDRLKIKTLIRGPNQYLLH